MISVSSPDSLVARFEATPFLPELVGALAREARVGVRGIAGTARVLLAVALADRLQRPVAIVLEDEDERDAAEADLSLLRPGLRVLVPDPQDGRAVAVLRGVEPGEPSVLVLLGHDLELPLPEEQPEDRRRLVLVPSRRLSPEDVARWLDDAGYGLVDLVAEPGEYARRGGIVDVFPERADDPVRVEFVGDAVESVRSFDPLTQRSSGPAASVELLNRRPLKTGGHTIARLLPDRTVLVTTGRHGPERPEFEGACVRISGPSDPWSPGRDSFDLGFAEPGSYLGNFTLLKSELAASPLRWYLACGSTECCRRLRDLSGAKTVLLPVSLSRGFIGTRTGIGLLTERELFGFAQRRAARRRFRGLPIDNLVSLRPGDHVVHVDYGIGVFEGTRRIRHERVEKDYLTLLYAGGDRVMVPVEKLALVDRYVGGRESPKLDRIGGRSWLMSKARAARASLEYAGELLENTARRSVVRGTAFPPDGEWHRELAAAFPFEMTPDQARALAAVGQDMESDRPMERLVCGDVGYGKTEVALRAAFKAVVGLKQVALLAPTTLLCWQHFDTFRRRFAPFPFRVEMLSRLVSSPARRRILDDLAAGKVDVVIATHSLLAAAPRFRDLGLLIVDEEQKFGVRQKELIKSLRTGVDVLSLSATPVPRTLYLALVGLRDISTIHTPPAGRREVLTEVSPWDDALVSRYVERELARQGQVFFIHNRIRTLGVVERRLRRLFPGVDIAVAHGRLPPRRLEDLYLDFAVGRHPVLLSTAIIESGIDLPNVNTIIVDRADTFGLADLHQLRGRVGRSGRQAHALFLIPTGTDITAESRKRLSALIAYSRLGAGFRLALRDLEIRGAGDLLGTRQHGQVARVGLNLYAKMVREAAARLQGRESESEPELSLELNAYLPESYVPDGFERVALYRRLLRLDTEDELREFDEELVDRFGRYPPVVADLLQVALVRILARRAGLLRVEVRAGGITITHPERTERIPGGIRELLERLTHRPARPQSPGRRPRN